MKYFLLIFSFPLLLACKGSGGATNESSGTESFSGGGNEVLLAYSNVENLFDTVDNPDKIDEDFTPEGGYKWDEQKYRRKLYQLAKAIKSIGKNGPDILGLGEVENAEVVADLAKEEQLSSRNYKYVHVESPDMRGIDVAFMYDAKKFKLRDQEA